MVLILSSFGMQAPFGGIIGNGLLPFVYCAEGTPSLRNAQAVRTSWNTNSCHQATARYSRCPTMCSAKYAASSPTPANRADPRDHCQLRPTKHRLGRGEIPR